MQLSKGQVAVVTGAASGIGYALADSFARKGLDVVLADVQEDALGEAAARIAEHGVSTLAVRTDVSSEASVQELARSTVDRFGAVHVLCNNAGVAGKGDPWTGPLSAWEWVMGVNFWGVVHGVRAFLPHLLGGGHIVNTASIAGLFPGFGASYDASKHAVVAISEDLYHNMNAAGLPVGVSCLCPGWVRTGIMDADRNWPSHLGDKPADMPLAHVMTDHVRRAIDEGMTPAAVADLVVQSVEAQRFWVLPHQDFLEMAIRRWHRIADRLDPVPDDQTPGLPPREQIMAEVAKAMEELIADGG